jgi:hypothetical protein
MRDAAEVILPYVLYHSHLRLFNSVRGSLMSQLEMEYSTLPVSSIQSQCSYRNA